MQARRFFVVALIFSIMIISACSDNPFEPQGKLENHALNKNLAAEVSANLVPTKSYMLNFTNPWVGLVKSYGEDGFSFVSEGNMMLTGNTLRLNGSTGRVTCSRFDGQPFTLYSFIMRTPGHLTVTSAAGGSLSAQVQSGAPVQISFEDAEGWNNIISFQLEVELQDLSGPEEVEINEIDEFSLSTGGMPMPKL